MNTTVLQYAKNLADDCIILPGLLEAGPRLIEHHIKSKAFFIANPKLPSQGPPSKKQQINLNSTPPSVGNSTKQGANYSSSSNYGRGGRKFGGHYGGRNQGGRGSASARRGRPSQHSTRSDK